ncbi:MAG: YqaE/Pmp3 family membrane protein [Opitutae bacterium]|nr:YqaE/Pmp3 family membrane protein [Opitutae bacterium]
MSVFRVLLCIILPPLAVIDKGCGSLLIVFILTLLGWIPGMIGALVILSGSRNNGGGNNSRLPQS